jgi:hypothetical protein
VALYKYDGQFDQVEVRIAGEYAGTVEKGGSLAVPDELAGKTGWSEHWSKQEDSPSDEENTPEESHESIVSEGSE